MKEKSSHLLNSTFRDTEAHDWRQSRARTRGTSTYRQVLSRKRAAQAHAHAGQRAGPLRPLRTTSDVQHQILNLKSCWKMHSPHALNQRRRERSGWSLSPLYSADTQSTAFWAAPGGPLGPAHAQGSAPPRLATCTRPRGLRACEATHRLRGWFLRDSPSEASGCQSSDTVLRQTPGPQIQQERWLISR